MSTEEKAKDLAGEETHEGGKSSGAAGPIILSFILGLAASMVLGWVIFPKLLYSQKEQPVEFNHVLHMAEVGNDCSYCHYFREDGSFAGIPTLASCAECHSEVLGDSEAERHFYEEYVEKDREVPWLVYSRQPDCVFFSHAAHVLMGQMDCVTCHGHIGESDHMKPYEYNVITGYSRDIWGPSIAGFKKDPWDRMKMDDCAECHAREGVGVEREDAKNPVEAHFLETVNMIWPTTVEPTRGTSVQTHRGGCFVCHH
jgi:hypothetical protein